MSKVQKPLSVVATKESRSVGKMTSGERGKTTVLCAGNGRGTFTPPVFSFSKRFSEAFEWRTPGCIGIFASNGWMDGDCFMERLRHFVTRQTNPTGQTHSNLDGHNSHKTQKAIDFARPTALTKWSQLTYLTSIHVRQLTMEVQTNGWFPMRVK